MPFDTLKTLSLRAAHIASLLLCGPRPQCVQPCLRSNTVIAHSNSCTHDNLLKKARITHFDGCQCPVLKRSKRLEPPSQIFPARVLRHQLDQIPLHRRVKLSKTPDDVVQVESKDVRDCSNDDSHYCQADAAVGFIYAPDCLVVEDFSQKEIVMTA